MADSPAQIILSVVSVPWLLCSEHLLSLRILLLLSLVPVLSFPLHRAATVTLFADLAVQDLRTLWCM